MLFAKSSSKRSCQARVLLLFILHLPFFYPETVFAQAKEASTTVAAGSHYQKSAFHRFWWGKHYRRIWAEPVEVPYFRLQDFKGGAKPLVQGGSFQTKNLRIMTPDNQEYVLRSIDKDPSKALPPFLQRTFVANLMRDQTSVIHPYGAFIVPALAKAADVYHTNPMLVYIADDPALGEFRHEFAHMLALLEERPDGNWKNLESFGNPEEVISSKKAFERMVSNPLHQGEARRYLRSRLFDMWLGDWSRREDQWRWAVHWQEGITHYSPIPRDRDHAFFKFNDGVLTKMVSLFKPNYQSFDKTIESTNVKGLMKSSKEMDAYLLTYVTKEEFEQEALALQQKLTDAVIDQALQQWPPQIQELSLKKFSTTLKSRRKDLLRAARVFYKEINREVHLPGTDGEDLFELSFEKDGTLLVQHWDKTPGKDKRLLHHRTFHPSETKQLSIYGLGEEDTFLLKGEGTNKMQLKLYGGEETDELQLAPGLRLKGKKIQVLDEEYGNEYPRHRRLKKKTYTPAANEFDGKGWLLRYRLH
ncbi:hypothetical protein [Rufibacter immobilis]|uniref:hypothetical protein n=1 Tax=Rufibacter immobilis TaxID=1348778 RepID=UPI0035E54EE8